jgi:hypothetical protein
MAREKGWIDIHEIKSSPNQMYRAYIFNFQEDMWKYIYQSRDHINDRHDKAAKRFFKIMKKNAKMFKEHLKDPDDLAVIEYHVQLIEVWMNEMVDEFDSKLDKSSVFYLAVKKVHDEFGM